MDESQSEIESSWFLGMEREGERQKEEVRVYILSVGIRRAWDMALLWKRERYQLLGSNSEENLLLSGPLGLVLIDDGSGMFSRWSVCGPARRFGSCWFVDCLKQLKHGLFMRHKPLY